MCSYAYYNGKFGKKEEISIPLSDRSIYFGDAVYDVALGSYDRIMWESEHLDRLLANAKRLGIIHPYSKKHLSELCREAAVKTTLKSYLLYIQLSRSYESRKHSAVGCAANLLITLDPFEINESQPPLKLVTEKDIRYSLCDVKTVNLIPSVMSATRAEMLGCDEGIFIKNGIVTECTKSNILIIKQGRVITHPNSNRILPGVARAKLLEKCASSKIEVSERPFTKKELFTADEVLLTSTTKLCRRASTIDGKAVGGKNKKMADFLCKCMLSEYFSTCFL